MRRAALRTAVAATVALWAAPLQTVARRDIGAAEPSPAACEAAAADASAVSFWRFPILRPREISRHSGTSRVPAAAECYPNDVLLLPGTVSATNLPQIFGVPPQRETSDRLLA